MGILSIERSMMTAKCGVQFNNRKILKDLIQELSLN